MLPILATKYHVPRAHPNTVPRRHLIQKLDEGLWQNQGVDFSRRLTLVAAPAGYGKTTLLCEWISHLAIPVAWITFDQADNDPRRFFQYLVAALQTTQPGIGETVLDVFQSLQFTITQLSISNVMILLVSEIATLSQPFILAFDDYHTLEDQAIHQAVMFLLDHLPEKLSLVIATRADPPLSLSRLRAGRQLVEVRSDDLRFTDNEAETFFRQVMHLNLKDIQIATLAERTEGWIAGLQMAALALQEHTDTAGFIQEFSGRERFVIDYLFEEVLSRQPDFIQTFLIQTSILERMTGPLCDALLGDKGIEPEGCFPDPLSPIPFSNSQQILEYLERANLFLVPLDDERCYYRYHHLFADLLRHRLHRSSPDHIPGLHSRAAEWYEANHFIGEAIHHALAAKDQERVARLVEQNAMSMLMRGELAILSNWIKTVETLAHKRPWLNVYQSWALTLTGQLDRAGPWLQDAEQLISSYAAGVEVEDILGHIAAIRAYQAAQRGEALNAISFADQALKYLPERNQAVRSVVMLTLGTSRRLSGDLSGAVRALEEAVRMGQSSGNFYLALGALSGLADILHDQGKLHQASNTYSEMLQRTTRPDGQRFPAAGLAYFGLGMIYYEWNDLETALQNTRQSIELCRKWGNVGILMGSYALLFRIMQVQGESEGARTAFDEAERLARENPLVPRAASWVESLRARSWLAQGDIDAAGRWAEQRNLRMDDDFTLLREFEYLTLIRVFLAQKNYHAAISLSDRMRHSAEAIGRRGSLIEILVLQALTFQEMGDYSRGLAVLEQALSLAEPEGYLRVFLDEGAPMAKLLRHAGLKGVAPNYVSRILSEFDKVAVSAPIPQQPLIEPLSDRELEVLRLVAAGLSNKEIAERLVISVGTVKAHTSSIYRKLEVPGRTKAVARAREIHLL